MTATTLDPVVLPSALVPPSDIAEDIRNQDAVQKGDSFPRFGSAAQTLPFGLPCVRFFREYRRPSGRDSRTDRRVPAVACNDGQRRTEFADPDPILAITLTQMVLNQQRRNELALHLKIDELITALDGARDELAGIETADEDTLLAARRATERE